MSALYNSQEPLFRTVLFSRVIPKNRMRMRRWLRRARHFFKGSSFSATPPEKEVGTDRNMVACYPMLKIGIISCPPLQSGMLKEDNTVL